MKKLLKNFCIFGLAGGCAALTGGCLSSDWHSYPPMDSQIYLQMQSQEFYIANRHGWDGHRWPKDYAELFTFVQQSNGKLVGNDARQDFEKRGFARVVFTALKNGDLEIYTVYAGVTNQYFNVSGQTNQYTMHPPKFSP
jgi:hypothetical protein